MKIEDLNIEGLVKDVIKSELSEIDVESLVKEVAHKLLGDSLLKKMESMTAEVVDKFISESIARAMTGPIVISDGWSSSRKTFASFEEFVKGEFQRNLSENHKIREVIGRLAKERVDALMKNEYGKVTEKIVDVLTQSTLVKK